MSVVEQLCLTFVGLRMKVASYLQTKQDELKINADSSWRSFAKDRNDIRAKQQWSDNAQRLQGHERRMALFHRIFPDV